MAEFNEEHLKAGLQNPASMMELLDKADAEESLRDFIPLIWDQLEPGRAFVHGWAVDAVCDHLQAVSEGHIRKLLINIPPGCMKSLTTQVIWPAWEWGPRNRPDLRYICASYSQDLTIRDNQRCRNIIKGDVYQKFWGDRCQISSDQDAKRKFETTARGFKFATSVGGTVTGERGDRVIVDDPHKVDEAESTRVREEALFWFSEVLPTRVNDASTAAFIVIMQRVHERDVSGLILAEELGYEHLMLPMEFEPERKCVTSIGFSDPRTEEGELLWPERFPREYVENDLKPALRSTGGTYAEAGQLQQRPTPRGGGMFERSKWNFIELSELEGLKGRRVRGYDLAATDARDNKNAAATASCCGFIDQHNRVIITDVQAYRKGPGEVKRMMRTTAENDGPRVEIDLPQDPGQAGKTQIVDLVMHLQGFTVKHSLESGSKELRAEPLASQLDVGNVYLVRAPWNKDFIDEAANFPRGQFKDRVDAASRMYSNLVRRKPRLVAVGGKVIEATG